MKKIITAILLLTLASCLLLSSCSAINNAKYDINVKVKINKLKEDYAFKVVSENPMGSPFGITFSWYSNVLMGKKKVTRYDWNGSYNGTEQASQNRAWFEERLSKDGLDIEEVEKTYGRFSFLRIYTDFCVAVTSSDAGVNAKRITVFKITETEIKSVKINGEVFGSYATDYYREGNRFYIARLNAVVDLDTMTVSNEEVPVYDPPRLVGTDKAAREAREYMAKSPELEYFYEKTAAGATLHTAREKDGKLFYAASVGFNNYSELYCLIFDAETGEPLYVAIATTPKMKDDETSLKGRFCSAEPVLLNGNGYYDIF